MLESGSRRGPSRTQFGNLNLDDVPQHVLAVLDPLQSSRQLPQQQAVATSQARTGDDLHSGVSPPCRGSQRAEQQGQMVHRSAVEEKNELEGNYQHRNFPNGFESKDELSARKMEGEQASSIPIEISYTLRNPESMPRSVWTPVKGSIGVTIDKGTANHAQPVAADNKHAAKEDSRGGSLEMLQDKGQKHPIERQDYHPSGATKGEIMMHAKAVLERTAHAANYTGYTAPSQDCQAEAGKPAQKALAKEQEAHKPKPKVVSAIPSTAGSQLSKKPSWATVASKHPVRVPYTTCAAGTSMPQEHCMQASSQPLGTSSRCKSIASGANGCNTGVQSGDQQVGTFNKMGTHQKGKAHGSLGFGNRHHAHQYSMGRGKQNSQPYLDNLDPSKLISAYVLGQQPSPSHHQTCSEPNLALHHRHVQSASQVDDVQSMPSAQRMDGSQNSSGAHASHIKVHHSRAHPKDDNGDTGQGPRKPLGRQPQDTGCVIHGHEKNLEQSKRVWSSRGTHLAKSRSAMSPNDGQHAQKKSHYVAVHSLSKAATIKQRESDRMMENCSSKEADPVAQGCGTSRTSADIPTSLEGLHGDLFAKPVKSEKIVNLVDFLCSTESMQPCRFWEQGITNLGNTCFLGSALQLLLGSGHFCAMLVRFGVLKEYFSPARLPTLIALGELANKLGKRPNIHENHSTRSLGSHGKIGRSSQAIVPTMLSPILESFHKRFASQMGGPEEHDAQEFLLFLLDRIESELMLIKAHVRGHEDDEIEPETDSDEWMIAGKKNKATFRRTAGSKSSNILISLFCGTIESHVCVKDQLVKNKTPSVTTHRFTALDLDIANDKVNSIDDALKLYTAKDTISGYRVEGCSRPVTAEKANFLGNMPPVLLVSLKRYIFTERGMEKIQKRISFQSTLRIPGKLMVAKEQPANYELIATCSHHGQGHGGDHYTSNVKQPDGSWIHFDDSMLYNIKEKDVMSDTPYLMLYMKTTPRVSERNTRE